MNAVRYVLLALFALAPVCASAQGPDSVHVEYQGTEYPGYGAAFGQRFNLGEEIGPLPLVTVESGPTGEFPDSPPDEGCNPYTPESAAEVEGNIAIVERGVCTFVLKVQNAVAAGAVAVVVFNDEREGPESETLVQMGGDCEPEEGCTIPAAFISRASGLEILTNLEFGGPAIIIPIRVSYELPCFHCVGTHDTGTVKFDVFDQGFLGTDIGFAGQGFVFDGVNGLFVSTVLVGVDGNVATNPYDGASEWTRFGDGMMLPAPFPEPFDDFDQGFIAAFENTDLGVRVTERSYSRAGDPFVIVELEVENVSGSDLEDVYVGIFADWDAGTTSADDRGGVNEELGLVYVFDPVEAGPYFGVSWSEKAMGPLSGYSTDTAMGTDAQLWEALTTAVAPGAEPAERAAVTGTGPYDLAAGSSQTVRFAFVAGVDLADLLANARRAQLPIATSAEATPAGTFALGAAYPNPLSDRATIGFTLPTAQRVRLAVYDVLGREVAVLVDGARPAGAQAVAFDAAGLPSGVYLYRLEVTDPARGAGGTVLTQRLTLVR
ncbi:MAG: PA domain-containing protein [Rhodothermales bacterium]